METPPPTCTNTLLLSASEHCWHFRHLGKRVRRRRGHHWELGSFTQKLQGRGWGFGETIYFPNKSISPPQKGDFRVHGTCWACPQGGSPAVEQGDSVTPEDRGWLHVISLFWVRCCWENTIILDLQSPHPCSLRRTSILVGVLAQSVEDDRSPVRKWRKERVMFVMVLPSWFPEGQGSAGMCSRRTRNVGGVQGLMIISLLSKSNTKENSSFVSKSLTPRMIW